MCKYALIKLNMIKDASIYLKKQSAAYARILNVSGAGFVELGHFSKHSIKITGKRGPSRKYFGVFFSPRYS